MRHLCWYTQGAINGLNIYYLPSFVGFNRGNVNNHVFSYVFFHISAFVTRTLDLSLIVARTCSHAWKELFDGVINLCLAKPVVALKSDANYIRASNCSPLFNSVEHLIMLGFNTSGIILFMSKYKNKTLQPQLLTRA